MFPIILDCNRSNFQALSSAGGIAFLVAMITAAKSLGHKGNKTPPVGSKRIFTSELELLEGLDDITSILTPAQRGGDPVEVDISSVPTAGACKL